MTIHFTLDEKQIKKFEEWVAEVRTRAAAAQALEDTDGPASPYYGAIGGGITFSFTPTSLGTVTKAKEAITGEEIDLSDYINW